MTVTVDGRELRVSFDYDPRLTSYSIPSANCILPIANFGLIKKQM